MRYVTTIKKTQYANNMPAVKQGKQMNGQYPLQSDTTNSAKSKIIISYKLCLINYMNESLPSFTQHLNRNSIKP